MNTKTKARNRILSLALALCLLPAMTLALPGPVTVSAAVGIENGLPSSVTVGKANTPASDSTAGGPDASGVTVLAFGGQEWYVIGYDGDGVYSSGNTMTLLATDNIGTSYFGTTSPISGYNGNDLHNAIWSIHSAMDSREQGIILARDLTDTYDSDTYYNGSNTPIQDQPLWPLSVSEAQEVSYSVRGAATSGSTYWWLRSPTSYTSLVSDAVAIVDFGVVDVIGRNANNLLRGVRPAFQLNLDSVLLTSDASGASAKSSATVGSGLVGASAPTGAVKLTVLDSSMSLTNVTATSVTGNIINLSYTANGSCDSLSAIVQKEDGSISHYGRLANNPSGNGSSTVVLPTGLDPADRLLVFVEQINNANETDYASDPVGIVDGWEIGTHPAPQSVTDGDPAAFSVSVPSGFTYTYQWQENTDGGGIFTDISGAQSDCYAIAATDTAMNGNQYRVVVEDEFGREAVSDPALLTVQSLSTAAPSATPTALSLHLQNSPTGKVQLSLGMSSDGVSALATGATASSSDTDVATVPAGPHTGAATVTATGAGTASPRPPPPSSPRPAM